MRVIHYGSKKLGEIHPVVNRVHFNKPSGGLWTSPIDSEYGWKDWCHENDFRKCSEGNCIVLDIINPRIFTIHSLQIEDRYWVKDNQFGESMFRCLDFELITQEFDVIHLTLEALKQGYPNPFYAWDCETVLILNDRVELRQINVKEVSGHKYIS